MVYNWHIPVIGIEDKWPTKFSYLFSLDAPKHNMALPQLYALSRQSSRLHLQVLNLVHFATPPVGSPTVAHAMKAPAPPLP